MPISLNILFESSANIKVHCLLNPVNSLQGSEHRLHSTKPAMNLFEMCERWMQALGIWPSSGFGWMLKLNVVMAILYLGVPEVIYLTRNYMYVDRFGSCYCEMMVVCQGLVKMTVMVYYKANWRDLIQELNQLYRDCE